MTGCLKGRYCHAMSRQADGLGLSLSGYVLNDLRDGRLDLMLRLDEGMHSVRRVSLSEFPVWVFFSGRYEWEEMGRCCGD